MINVLYRLMRLSYEKLYGEQQMLHYPLYKDGSESLLQGQTYLTDYCLSHLRDLDDKRLLDIGCGNGIQTLYIGEKYRPLYLYGVDLNRMHVDFARQEKQRRGLSQIDFGVDNAQSLASVADSSFDAAICIESSHHYPNKCEFLSQLKRVLRPGGQFVIADLIRKDDREPSRLEGKLFLFHWHPQRYRDAVSQLKMALLTDEDITDSILPAFRSTEHWLDKPDGVSAGSHRMGRLLGRALIALYKLQLERYFRYHLLVGRRD
jgi:cyclopropane fatty-acyl-phospholipid synthase-like methyltransferase